MNNPSKSEDHPLVLCHVRKEVPRDLSLRENKKKSPIHSQASSNFAQFSFM